MTPFAKSIPAWCWWDNLYTEDELNYLQAKCKNADSPGLVGGNEGLAPSDVRRCKIDWLKNTPECNWLYEKLASLVSNINSTYYNFDLNGFGEPFQLTHYESDDSGMYNWHQDFNTGNISRKLSVVIQLSDPLDYTGGDLQLLDDGGKTVTIKKKRGYITIFPSYTLHQVTPVLSGNRQSAVAWISGPAFK